MLDNIPNVVTDNVEYGKSVLITLHRRENELIMPRWFKLIDQLASKYKYLSFVFPIHPNPIVQRHKQLLKNVVIMEPMSHNNLMMHLAMCRLVITDSGGIQEEASFLNKKVIVCREVTERPEGLISGHLTLCKKPHQLPMIFDELINSYEINEICPYGDGKAAKRIAKIIYDEQ